VRLRLAAVLAAVALTGCGGSPKPEVREGAPTTREAGGTGAGELRALLDRRAQALLDGDVAAYAATGVGAQASRDREAARRARPLGLRSVRLQALEADVRDERARLRVSVRYSLRGVPGSFESRGRVQARRTSRGWRIAEVGGGRERPPWEVGRFVRLRSPHFVILAPPDVPEGPLVEALEAGYEQTGEVLVRPRLARRYLVVVASGAPQARALTELIRGVGGLAAIADAEVREEGDAQRVSEVVSQRLLVVWPQFERAQFESRRRVVTHELTHSVLAEVTSGRTPSWLLEGVALYVSGDRRVGDAARLLAGAGSRGVRRALTLAGLSEPDAIARLDGAGQAAAYTYSSAAAFYIAARFGERRLLRLYEAFNDEAIAGFGVESADAAVRDVLGRPLARLERDLRRWIVTRAVVAPLSP
jgi:hypothetical protein